MKGSELKELSIEELERRSGELRAELFNVRIKKATGQLENTARLRSLRRDIARTETVLCEKRGATQ
jgi:large subunit ribosomal protein L29